MDRKKPIDENGNEITTDTLKVDQQEYLTALAKETNVEDLEEQRKMAAQALKVSTAIVELVPEDEREDIIAVAKMSEEVLDAITKRIAELS